MKPLREVLIVSIRHHYFSQGGGGALALRPTPSCLARLRRHGARFEPRTDGGAVHAAQGEALFADPSTVLDFALTATRSDLLAITELPDPDAPPADTIRVFTNTAGAPAGTLSGGAALPAVYARCAFAFADGPVPHAVAAMRGGHVVATGIVGPHEATLDLGGEAEVDYTIVLDGAVAHRVCLTSEPAARRFGVAAIDATGADAQRLSASSGPPVAFTLSLAARSAIWRYHIQTRRPLSLGDARVESGLGVGFSRRAVAAGRPGLVFEADAPIRFAERLDAKVAPVLVIPDEDAAIMLPAATAGAMRRELAGDADRTVAEIHVTL